MRLVRSLISLTTDNSMRRDKAEGGESLTDDHGKQVLDILCLSPLEMFVVEMTAPGVGVLEFSKMVSDLPPRPLPLRDVAGVSHERYPH